MPSKQSARRTAARNANALNYRSFGVRADSVNAEGRTVDTVIATEAPVPMMDWERWELIPEVLRADGAILPPQVPLLDSHSRHSMSDQFGSARSIQAARGEVTGTLHFGSNQRAEDAFTQVREGHATDVSAGYQVLERTFVPKGTRQSVLGREYTGPVNVVTKWRLREVSLTPIGADEQAKLRGFDPSQVPAMEGFRMNEELRKLLESRGMPAELSDDEAQRWAIDNNFGEKKPEGKTEERKDAQPDVAKLVEEATRRALEAAEQQRVELRATADTLLKIAGREDLRDKAYNCRSREEIEKLILDDNEARSKSGLPTVQSIKVSGEGAQRKAAAIQSALTLRAMNAVVSPEPLHENDNIGKRRAAAFARIQPADKLAPGHEDFRNIGLFRAAEIYVRDVWGIDTSSMTREEIATYAMIGPTRAAEYLGQYGRRDVGAYHTTGSFTNLTLDAVNKSMQLGYMEYPSTWETCFRRGASAQDFKELHRVRMGAIPNLPIWPDASDPKKVSIADAREHYAVESRSAEISFSYKLIVNDDMDALSRTPAQLGAAARRTVNASAWAQITGNPTMSDSVALFATATGNRKRTNLTTGAGAPSVTTVQTLSNLMMQMRGENTPEQAEGDDILGLQPRYIVGPSALSTTIKQLVLSVYDPAASAIQVYNTAAELVPIIEPLLDASSTTAWYLFADPSQIDTVEVTFLAGQESPVVRQFMDERQLAQNYIVLQTFAAKALNHRGMQKHAGA